MIIVNLYHWDNKNLHYYTLLFLHTWYLRQLDWCSAWGRPVSWSGWWLVCFLSLYYQTGLKQQNKEKKMQLSLFLSKNTSLNVENKLFIQKWTLSSNSFSVFCSMQSWLAKSIDSSVYSIGISSTEFSIGLGLNTKPRQTWEWRMASSRVCLIMTPPINWE